MIRKRPELDTKNPPGQLVNPISPSKLYKPSHGGYPVDPKFEAAHFQDGRDLYDTEEAFAPNVVPFKRKE